MNIYDRRLEIQDFFFILFGGWQDSCRWSSCILDLHQHSRYPVFVLAQDASFLVLFQVLTYVAEIAQPHLRGMLSATASMSVILGVFLQFVFGIFMTWRTVALVNIVFPILAICALCCVPESPHWLIGGYCVSNL